MNKTQRRILLTKIAPKLILVIIIVLGILAYFLGPIYLRKKNDEFYNDPKTQEIIREIRNKE